MKRKANGQFEKGNHWRDKKPFWNKEWLEEEYLVKLKSANEIALPFKVTEQAIYFWLKKHKIPVRNTSDTRKIKHWGLLGSDNPMWNKKGELNPRWQGGISPERQSFYSSQEWKTACSKVWKRDNAICQRCKLDKRESYDMPFHIHHVISFKIVEKRADINNLVLLCECCHHFVHSKKNIDNEYIQ